MVKIGQVGIDPEEVPGWIKLGRDLWRLIFVPKNKRGRLGIVIAFHTEGNREKQLLGTELIRELQKSLDHSSLTEIFWIVRFPDRLSSKITSPRTAERYLRKSRSNLIVYGDLLQRFVDATQSYVFRLNGVVIHRAVPTEVSQQLATDFRQVLPRSFAFPETDELFGFEIARQWIGDVATYVVGIAVGLSGDLHLSHRLFQSLEQSLQGRQQSTHPVASQLLEKTNLRVIEVTRAIMHFDYLKFVESRDRTQLLGHEGLVADLLLRLPDDYNAKLSLSMIRYFQGRVDEAIAALRSVKSSDATWLYNLAFLYAYKGDVDESLEHYRRAFYGSVATDIIVHTEVFISDAFDEGPDRKQLLFFRGLINHKAKNDLVLSREDFEHFLNDPASKTFPRLVELAKKYLSECDSRTSQGPTRRS